MASSSSTGSLLRDRTFRALALAAALIVVWAWKGPLTDSRMPTQQMLRHEWTRCADVVVVGDSTVRFGIAPELVERELGAYRVVNFAYLDTSLENDAYLDAAEHVLDPASESRALVIGINAWNLQGGKRGQFVNEARALARARETDHAPSLELTWQDELEMRLRPRGLCTVLWDACPWHTRFPLGYNGHSPLDTSWRDETFRAPWAALQLEDVDLDVAPAHVIQRITAWQKRGIHVIAYVEHDRPAVARLSRAHGFDADRIERELRSSGAIVVPYPTDIVTTDGLHLNPPSAARWSRDLGRALAAVLLPRPTTPPARCAWPLQTRP